MALNKLFIHFQTKSAFNEQKENILDTSIAFIKETGEIYTHDKLYGSISVASSTANGLMPKEHYSIIDKESNNLFVTELSNNVSTTADKVYIQYKSRYFGDDLKHNNICNILSATSTNAGVMSATDKRKLDSLSNYTLPTADSSTLGGIKIGSGLNIDSNGTVSVDNKLYILVNSLESVTTPDANKIYLVLNSSSTSETNSFTEYVWITSNTGGKWEKLGEASATVDLANYYTKTEIDNRLSSINNSITELDSNKVDKQDVATTAKNGLLSKEDKIKLDSIETGANKYVLPEAGNNTLGGIKAAPSNVYMAVGTINNKYINEKNVYGSFSYHTGMEKVLPTYYQVLEATTEKYGLMSPEDKVKLNNINVSDFDVDLTPYAKTADVTSAIDAAKTELTGDIATAKSQAISEAKSEAATAVAQLNRIKTSWANGGTVSSETYYNILKGTQDSFTLPFDLNGFVSHITANGNAQRYSGVIIAVSYANTSEQPKQRSDTLYLPFAAVNAEKGVVAFEDLQFHYTDLAGTDVDVRYKVTPASNSQIKLEKVKESANKPDTSTAAAKPPTFLIRGDGGDTLDMVAMEGFNLTPEQMTDGSVDGFQIYLPDSVAQQLESLLVTLMKYQNPGSSAICVALKDPIDVLPRFMLCFLDGCQAYPFYVMESYPAGGTFILKGEIPTQKNYNYVDFATWLVTIYITRNNSKLIFTRVK